MKITPIGKGKFLDPKKIVQDILDKQAQDLKRKLEHLSCPVHHQHPIVMVQGTKLDIENVCCDELAAKVNAVVNP